MPIASSRARNRSCKVVRDERSALEIEIARLQGENATLKKELLARGLPVPGVSGPSGAKPGEPELKLPSDAEVDKVISFLEKVWRRLRWGGPCRGTSRRKIEELAGRCCSAQAAAALERSARRPRIATRLPAVSHIASIKYPTLLNDSALANDNKKLLMG